VKNSTNAKADPYGATNLEFCQRIDDACDAVASIIVQMAEREKWPHPANAVTVGMVVTARLAAQLCRRHEPEIVATNLARTFRNAVIEEAEILREREGPLQ
jgi:hypothetical protein